MKKMPLNITSSAIVILISILIVGCGPSLNDAKQMGFESVEEMTAAQKQGFKNKAEVNEAEAKKAGFASYEEFTKRRAQGFRTNAEVEVAKQLALGNGFESIEEMLEGEKAGYKTKSEYTKAKAEAAEKLAREQRERAERERVSQYSEVCERVTGWGAQYLLFRDGSWRLPPSAVLLATTVGVYEMKGFELDRVDGGARIPSANGTMYSAGSKNLVKAGIATFKNRQIAACLERVNFTFTNRGAGERAESCVSVFYLFDKEFDTWRGIESVFCNREESALKSWKEENQVSVLLDLK